MNSQFDFSNVAQSKYSFDEWSIHSYGQLIGFSKKHHTLARFIGLPLAVCSTLVNLASSIATIAESVFKGIGNVFGAPFSPKCDFLKGVKQLFVQSSVHLSHGLVNLLLIDIPNLLITPARMMISPLATLDDYKKSVEDEKEMFDFVTTDAFDDIKNASQEDAMELGRDTREKYKEYFDLKMKYIEGFYLLDKIYYF